MTVTGYDDNSGRIIYFEGRVHGPEMDSNTQLCHVNVQASERGALPIPRLDWNNHVYFYSHQFHVDGVPLGDDVSFASLWASVDPAFQLSNITDADRDFDFILAWFMNTTPRYLQRLRDQMRSIYGGT